MTEHDKISSDVEAPASSEQVVAPSTGRRRLVKGVVLAAPAILMVRSGYSRPLASLADPEGAEAIQRICQSFAAAGYDKGDTSPTLASFGGYNNFGAFQQAYQNQCKLPNK